ncbi:CDP-glycerol glycerophosphotransferase family protein, partial [Streptosporangium sp. NPDC001682]
CDYAITGRPMLFLIDDWDEYRRVERGVYHDLPAIAPGPCLTTTEELIEALRDLDGVTVSFAARYIAFRRMWCAEEKGHASAKVVDAFFDLPSVQVPVQAPRAPGGRERRPPGGLGHLPGVRRPIQLPRWSG